ncbi:MAG: AAA family ATPase, partial [Pseudomonadota bacterium]
MTNYTNRKQYIDKLLSFRDKDLIKVVSGLRRSGKSTLLDIYREQLLKMGIGKRQIQFYNFELPENYLNKNWDDIYFDVKKKLQDGKPNYIF